MDQNQLVEAIKSDTAQLVELNARIAELVTQRRDKQAHLDALFQQLGATPQKRKPGRPRKDATQDAAAGTGRKRGRPRKNAQSPNGASASMPS